MWFQSCLNSIFIKWKIMIPVKNSTPQSTIFMQLRTLHSLRMKNYLKSNFIFTHLLHDICRARCYWYHNGAQIVEHLSSRETNVSPNFSNLPIFYLYQTDSTIYGLVFLLRQFLVKKDDIYNFIDKLASTWLLLCRLYHQHRLHNTYQEPKIQTLFPSW